MHSFQSPLISTIRLQDQNSDRIVFLGHYRNGDGASVPFLGAIVAVLLFLAWHFVLHHWLVLATAILVLVGFNAMLFYEKMIVFNLQQRRVTITTRTIWGTDEQTVPAERLRLQTEKIAIRLAEDCGAIDLVLPDSKIRLGVDGKYERSVAKAQSLSAVTGIPMAD